MLVTTEAGSPASCIISSMSFGLLDRSANIFFSCELSNKLLGSFEEGVSHVFKNSATGPNS